ncbi:MAG TPA: hypothetical protein PK788_00250 [Gemmatimonadaceae bacterium]|nr:hypothetical protein [Gemmatimonadaceae bacterium]HRQ77451.1 hypothetical protein [Gemmatimonadaceae bacterium]
MGVVEGDGDAAALVLHDVFKACTDNAKLHNAPHLRVEIALDNREMAVERTVPRNLVVHETGPRPLHLRNLFPFAPSCTQQRRS